MRSRRTSREQKKPCYRFWRLLHLYRWMFFIIAYCSLAKALAVLIIHDLTRLLAQAIYASTRISSSWVFVAYWPQIADSISCKQLERQKPPSTLRKSTVIDGYGHAGRAKFQQYWASLMQWNCLWNKRHDCRSKLQSCPQHLAVKEREFSASCVMA